MTKKLLTRRQIIKDATKAGIGSALLLNSPLNLFGQGESNTKVVLIRDENVLGSDNNPKPEILQKMLDKAVLNLTGVSDIKTAWKKIINPQDVVGIKSNEWGYLPTPPALENGIKKRVMEAGVSEKKISKSTGN